MNRFLEAANRGSELKKKASDANAAKSEAINREFSQPSSPAGAENAPPIDVAEQTQERLRLAMESVSAKPISKPARQPDVTNMRPSDLQLHNLAIARAGQDIELNLDNANNKKNNQTRSRMRSAFKNQGVDARLIVVVVALIAGAAGYWFILKPSLDKPATPKAAEKSQAQVIFGQGKYSKVIEMLDKKGDTAPLTEQETDLLHHAHYKQAEILVKQKHFADAKKLLKKIPDDSPHAAKAKQLIKKYRALRR